MTTGARMATIKLKYIQEFLDRHKKVRRYVRRPDGGRVPLPGIPGSPEFMAVYNAALSGAPVPARSRHADGTIGRLVTDFYRSAEFANLKPSSQKTYRIVLDPIVVSDGHRLVRDMPRSAARDIVEQIGVEKPGLANLTRSVLRRVFAYAVENELRPDNPFATIKPYKLGSIHTWTDEELGAFEKRWQEGTRERLAYAVLLYTAQRVGDAVRLRRPDPRSPQITLVQKKTGADVSIPAHPALMRALKAAPSNGVYMIGKHNGLPMTASGLSRMIERAAGEAKLPDRCVAHGLRKAAMRILAENGSTSKELQAVSGHRTLRQVERYTERADRALLSKAAIARLPDKTGTNVVKPARKFDNSRKK